MRDSVRGSHLKEHWFSTDRDSSAVLHLPTIEMSTFKSDYPEHLVTTPLPMLRSGGKALTIPFESRQRGKNACAWRHWRKLCGGSRACDLWTACWKICFWSSDVKMRNNISRGYELVWQQCDVYKEFRFLSLKTYWRLRWGWVDCIFLRIGRTYQQRFL